MFSRAASIRVAPVIASIADETVATGPMTSAPASVMILDIGGNDGRILDKQNPSHSKGQIGVAPTEARVLDEPDRRDSKPLARETRIALRLAMPAKPASGETSAVRRSSGLDRGAAKPTRLPLGGPSKIVVIIFSARHFSSACGVLRLPAG